jgi:hypothetical protein
MAKNRSFLGLLGLGVFLTTWSCVGIARAQLPPDKQAVKTCLNSAKQQHVFCLQLTNEQFYFDYRITCPILGTPDLRKECNQTIQVGRNASRDTCDSEWDLSNQICQQPIITAAKQCKQDATVTELACIDEANEQYEKDFADCDTRATPSPCRLNCGNIMPTAADLSAPTLSGERQT